MTIVASLLLLSAITLFILFGDRLPWRIDPEEAEAWSQRKSRTPRHHNASNEAPPLPLWVLGLIVSVLLLAIASWYRQDGKTILAVEHMTRHWQSQIDQVTFTGSSALQALPRKALTVFCPLLQRRIDRNDDSQLRALGDCYSADSQFAHAEPVYERLLQNHPNDSETILLWAQSRLFAHPDAPPRDVLESLERLIARDPRNLMARLLLASAYTRNGNLTAARPLWAGLKRDMARDHRLYPLVAETAAKLDRQEEKPLSSGPEIEVTVDIAEEVLDRLPEQSRLFVSVTRPGGRLAIAASALPLAAQTKVTLSDRDTIHGEKLAHYPRLEVHAKVTADGKATGVALASATSSPFVPTREHTVTLELIHD